MTDNPNLYKPSKWWAFDVETTGTTDRAEALMPWSPNARVISWASAWFSRNEESNKPRVASKASDDVQQINDFLVKAALEKRPVIGWNICFDVAWLIAMGYGDKVKQIDWIDGMVLWRHLERFPESDKSAAHRKQYGLKAAVREFLPQRSGYDDGVEFSVNQKATEDLLYYNREDASYTLAIGAHILTRLMRENPTSARLAHLTCQSIPLIATHYVKGLHVDLEYAAELDKGLEADLHEMEWGLSQFDVTPEIVASPAQLRKLLYQDWKLPVTVHTPKGAPSTDKTALHNLAAIDPRAKDIKEFREVKNLRTKFVRNVVNSAMYNGGTTHPTMNLCSTYTGRATFSSKIDTVQTGFAIHQMKRADRYRRLITPPPGHTIIEWDAAGQEFRWMAIMTGDPTMLRLCMPGEDPHSYMAALMSPYEYEEVMELNAQGDKDAKAVRTAGKVGNLSCQYRIGKESLLNTARVQYGLDWSLADAIRVLSTYHRAYPGVRKYWNRQTAKAKRDHYVDTLAGRRCQLPGKRWSKFDWMFTSAAVNFPVQGIGADQKYLAIAHLKPLLEKYDGLFYFELHDGIYCVFPDAVAEAAAYEGKEILDNLPYEDEWGFVPPIPLPFDIKLGSSWGDMIEL